MVGPEGLFANCQVAIVKWLGLGVAALMDIDAGQIVERGGDVGVIDTVRLLVQFERALKKWLGLGVAALAFVQEGEHAGRMRNIRMIWFEDVKGLLDKWLGLSVAALNAIEFGQVVER